MRLLVVLYPHNSTMDARVEEMVKLIESELYPNVAGVLRHVVKSFVVGYDIYSYVKESIMEFINVLANREGISIYVSEDSVKVITSDSKYVVKFDDKDSVIKVVMKPRQTKGSNQNS